MEVIQQDRNMKMTCQFLIESAQKKSSKTTAIVHPVTSEAVQGAIEAEKQKLIKPLFIGPIKKILKAAKEAQLSIAENKIIDVPHSHAAAEEAVKLVHANKVEMLMKGSLHTEELMYPILDKKEGLQTGRRMSHVFVAEIPLYPKLLLLTDCAINIAPTLMEKKDIVQNAIDLAISIHIDLPKVAILSATEMITEKIPSTIEAAALCKMAQRKQIQGGILDGPLAFDNAISVKAAHTKEIESIVAGDADILVSPNLETGNMLAKQLEYLAQAKLAGIVIGARIPIILTSRADPVEARLASCAVGILYGEYLQEKLWQKSCLP